MRKRVVLPVSDIITESDMIECNTSQWLDIEIDKQYQSRHVMPSDDFTDYDAMRGVMER